MKNLICSMLALMPLMGSQAQTGEFVRVGSVQVDAVARTVIATGFVNQTEGLVELLACGPGGKTHESILVLQANPVDLQAGLLLLGLKPGTPPAAQGEGQPTGPALDIRVEWDADGALQSVPASSLIKDMDTGLPLTDSGWVFTGSKFEDGKFRALTEESMIVTYWDPWAIINIASGHGSNDELLVANRKAMPTNGTPVTVRIRGE